MSGSSQRPHRRCVEFAACRGAGAKQQSRRRPSPPSPGTCWSRWRCGTGPCSQLAAAAQTRGPFPAPQARHASRPIPHSRKTFDGVPPFRALWANRQLGDDRPAADRCRLLPSAARSRSGATGTTGRTLHGALPVPGGVFLSTDLPGMITVTRRQRSFTRRGLPAPCLQPRQVNIGRQHLIGDRTLATNRPPTRPE
jgi:hypothetical protein